MTNYGEKWQLLFHHLVNEENVHFEANELLFYNNNNNKFSALMFLTEKAKFHGYFEFLLQYPEISLNYHWKQKINPLDTDQTKENDIGFKKISVPDSFKGLAKSSEPEKTFLDGTPGLNEENSSNWWWSIGSLTNYPDANSFPGPPRSSFGKRLGVKEVYLWLRVGYESPITTFFYTRPKISCFVIIFLI